MSTNRFDDFFQDDQARTNHDAREQVTGSESSRSKDNSHRNDSSHNSESSQGKAYYAYGSYQSKQFNQKFNNHDDAITSHSGKSLNKQKADEHPYTRAVAHDRNADHDFDAAHDAHKREEYMRDRAIHDDAIEEYPKYEQDACDEPILSDPALAAADATTAKDDAAQSVQQHHEQHEEKLYHDQHKSRKLVEDAQVRDIGQVSHIEVSKPKTVQQLHEATTFHRVDGKPPKRFSKFKTSFAAFLASAVVILGLMVAADQMNLFTSEKAYMSPPPVSSNGNDGGAIAAGTESSAEGIVRPNTISDIVKMAGPAVVKIETKVTRQMSNRYNDDMFRWFFGDMYTIPQQQQEGQLVPGGMGSGFIFEKNGYIFTNQHVIDGAEEIWVELEGYPEKFKAELLGEDYELDLAVIKIEGEEPFPTLKIGNSTDAQVGDWVTAIGNPVGFDHSVSVGVLSAKEREIQISDDKGSRGPRNYRHLLQTDASINPGNSGGPLLNLKGEVIGINTAVSTNAQGIGFAIPSSTLLDVVDRLKNGEKIEKPYIGVTLYDIDEKLAEQLQLKSTDGVVVVQVVHGSPAGLAGLRPYDVITHFNGEKITDSAALQGKIADAGVGQKATITFMRDGKSYDTGLVIGDRNNS